MGYDLKPIKRGVDYFHYGAFSWPWLMDEGVGLIVGQGAGKNPGTYSYQPRGKGGSPLSNDGYRITVKEAKMMAVVARGIVSKYEFINEQWDKLSEEERKKQENFDFYKRGVRKDFLEKAKNFADWAEKSGGFKIY